MTELELDDTEWVLCHGADAGLDALNLFSQPSMGTALASN
jgi:hypothetical protein